MKPTGAVRREHQSHPRDFGDNRYVYAVLSRRSGGISIGVNLNPDKRCNFDCVYCQVDRRAMPPPAAVDMAAMKAELAAVLTAAKDGELACHVRFRDVPPADRTVRDVAISGDGESTVVPVFGAAVEAVLEAVAETGWEGLPVVLITNASALDRPEVEAAIDRIMAAGGDVWAKLDAGTAEHFARVAATAVPFERILANLGRAAARHPLTIQTCWFALGDTPPTEAEADAYIDRLAEIRAAGGALRAVQLYTVARTPAQAAVAPLPASALRALADRVRARLPDVPVAVFP
jgi:wyosine [tRNA(Phe)-imidazoG37] synthetase (radical SAM superfamily)